MTDDTSSSEIEHPDFRVRERIAAGGMGAVLEVEEATTLRPVALKVMHPEAMQLAEARRRFLLEAKVMARLEHPNIVPLHVVRTDAQGRLFYTMKKVVGRDLQQILSGIRKGQHKLVDQFPLNRLLQVFQKVCEAVGYAHSRGVVHRDLKPANIMVGEFGEVLVMDWGLAKVIGQDEASPDSVHLPEEDTLSEGADVLDVGAGLTMAGALMGTPQYMAPEQAEGRLADIDARTDIWALGGILYSILTLHPPVTGTSLEELISRVRTGEIASPTVFNSSRAASRQLNLKPDFKLLHCPGRKIPAALSAIVRQAMQVDPAHRYPTAEDLREDVEAWQNGYATAAEKAGLFKEIALLIWRHKLISAGILTILAVVIAFGLRVRESQLRAEQTLIDLRASIPLIVADVDSLVDAGDHEGALSRLDQCIKLIPDRASFHFRKGLLLQASLKLAAADAALTRTIELDPGHKDALAALALNRRLSKSAPDTNTPGEAALRELRDHLISTHRFAELEAVNQALNAAAQARVRQLDEWRQQMKSRNAPDWAPAALRLDNEGRLSVSLSRDNLSSLEFLTGLPLHTLHLQTAAAIDVTPLKSMPLEVVHLRTPKLDDLSWLQGKKLKEIKIFETAETDFDFLSGMPLENVELDNRGLSNVNFLAASRVSRLLLRGNPLLTDLSPLKGKPLELLYIDNTAVTNLDFLVGSPLTNLAIPGTPITDLAPLRGLPLRGLNLMSTQIRDLSPLKGAPLEYLSMPYTKVYDLSPLREARLKTIDAAGTLISDLSPLAGQPLHYLWIPNTRVFDLRPLSNSQVRDLRLNDCAYLADLTGLESCHTLEYIMLPKRELNLDPIRHLPRLKKLSYGWVDWNKVAPVDQFWPGYDKWRRTRRFK